MSPNDVLARTMTGSSAGPGGSACPIALRTVPNCVSRSSQADTPAGKPTPIAPNEVSAEIVPPVTPSSLMSPRLVLSSALPSEWATVMAPLAVFTRSPAAARPIQMSPLEFFTTAGPASWPILIAPEPVLTSSCSPARPATRLIVMSPAPLRSRTAAASSRSMPPAPVL